jgi:hypothetical protein
MAMQDAGLLQEGDDPDPEQFANYLQRLNDLINLWQTQGLKLWLQKELSLPLTAGINQYALGPGGVLPTLQFKPMRILSSAYYMDSDGNRRPLMMISREEWMRLSTTVSQGPINSFFVDKQQIQILVNLWLTPDTQAATGHVILLMQEQVTNLVSLTDAMNFPQEWFIALRWGLADDICTGQPQAIMQRCMMKAALYLAMLESWDVEDASTTFAPDSRMFTNQGRFS